MLVNILCLRTEYLHIFILVFWDGVAPQKNVLHGEGLPWSEQEACSNSSHAPCMSPVRSSISYQGRSAQDSFPSHGHWTRIKRRPCVVTLSLTWEDFGNQQWKRHQWRDCCLSCQRMWLGLHLTRRIQEAPPLPSAFYLQGGRVTRCQQWVVCEPKVPFSLRLWVLRLPWRYILWSSGLGHCVAWWVGISLEAAGSYVTLKCWVFSCRTTWYPNPQDHSTVGYASCKLPLRRIHLHIDCWCTSGGRIILTVCCEPSTNAVYE
jgi:hypothetical protein